MKSRFFFFVLALFLFANLSVFSQTDKITLEDKITELSGKVKSAQSQTEKINIYEQLAICQEFAGLYSEASESYISCSRLVSDQEKKDSYILKASRCFLSCGDAEKTDELLTSIASTARTGKNAPLLKLYAAWSWISKCNTFEETHEPIVILKSYLKMDSMKSVKKEILFTLWYITLDENYSTILKNEFPESLETSILLGKTDLSPLPFWYFSARKEVPLKKDSESKVEVAKQEKEVENPKPEATKTKPENTSTKENLSEKQAVFT